MNNLSIERIWQDNDFFEIRVTAVSQLVQATTNVYITNSDILQLANALATFPQKSDSEISWQVSESSAIQKNLSLKVLQKDKFGHLLVEVYMIIKDGNCGENHHCCFYIQTEIGLLNTFGKRLSVINEPNLGAKITLVDDNI